MDALKKLKKRGEGIGAGQKNIKPALEKKISTFDEKSTNPWVVFINLKDVYYKTTIKQFINENLWRKTDIRVPDSTNIEQIDDEYINMFNYLLNNLPWWVSKNFLASCAKNKKEVLKSFSDFIQTPEIQEYKKQTRAFLLRRKGNRVYIKEAVINNSRLPYIFENYFDYFITELPKARIPPPLVRTTAVQFKTVKNAFDQPTRIKRPVAVAASPSSKTVNVCETLVPLRNGTLKALPIKDQKEKRAMFYDDNLFNACDSQYFYAPWILFKNIQGFVISNLNNKYATNLEVIDQFSQKWYKANKRFYKESCANIREFEPGAVGYIESKSTDRYKAAAVEGSAQTDNINIIVETSEMFDLSKKEWTEARKLPLNEDSFMIAKRLLQNNSVLNASLSSKELEKYTDDIIESFKPCIDNQDLAKKLSYVLVFLNKIINTSQQYHINIKNKLYKGSSLITLDKTVLLPEIYLSESDKPELLNEMTSKISIARLWIESEFFLLINKQRPHLLYIDPNAQLTTLRVWTRPLKLEKKGRRGDLAPGLIQKLKTLISQNKGCYSCFKDACGHSIFRSLYQGQEVVFCDSACMEQFEFKSKPSPMFKAPPPAGELAPGDIVWPPPRKQRVARA